MKRFEPLRTYSPPSSRASVRIAAESEPEPGSVNAYAGSLVVASGCRYSGRDLRQGRRAHPHRGGRVPSRLAVVEDGFDVVAVGIEHERAVVALVVDRPLAGSAVVTVPG